jgi:hypothetical protein
MIATGPYHHDFSFNLDKTSARLQFDLKISQTIETEIICNEAELELLSKEYPGETFNFSLGILVTFFSSIRKMKMKVNAKHRQVMFKKHHFNRQLRVLFFHQANLMSVQALLG